jgi:hypothetical protein
VVSCSSFSALSPFHFRCSLWFPLVTSICSVRALPWTSSWRTGRAPPCVF